jgi:ABC-type Mn2+/Zn2+ transport system permease subunit
MVQNAASGGELFAAYSLLQGSDSGAGPFPLAIHVETTFSACALMGLVMAVRRAHFQQTVASSIFLTAVAYALVFWLNTRPASYNDLLSPVWVAAGLGVGVECVFIRKNART